MKKTLIIITTIVLACMLLVSCSNKMTDNSAQSNSSSTNAVDLQEDANNDENQQSEQDDSTTVTTVVDDANARTLIESMYSDYDIKLEKTLDNVQYYVISKDNKQYASLKVDLLTGDCYETVTSTNELTTFNILS